tara:strand:- start:109321 stop:111087 length:1767 start_codon:yes stop_codon:yes gene_type:complete
MNLKEYIIENNYPNGREIRSSKHTNFVKELLIKTSFLDEQYNNVPLVQRLYCVLYEINSIPKCSCGNILPKGIDKQSPYYKKGGFAKFCSVKCSSENARKISSEKYGGHHMKDDSIKEKIKQTNKERYGSEHVFTSNEFKEKVKQTSKEKYGVEDYRSSEQVKQNRVDSVNERYGVDNVFQLESTKEKSTETVLEKYGVNHVLQSPEILDKSKGTCLQNHGVERPLQSKDILQKVIETNQERYGHDNYSKIHFTDEIIEALTNKQLLLELYEKYQCSRKIAEVIGVGSHRTVLQAMIALGIDRKNSYSVSSKEMEVRKFLEENNIDYIPNDRSLISPKECDIIIPEHKIVIEFNGMFWHSFEMKGDRNYHQNKSLEVLDKGYRIIHVYEDWWEQKPEVIKSKILHMCGKSNERYYARKCSVVKLTKEEYFPFLEKTHIQGSRDAKYYYGLIYEGKLVSVLGLNPSCKDEYEIIRYASLNCVGGFGKLLKSFIRKHNPSIIHTYVSLDYGNGIMYEKNGFEYNGMTNPNYFYYDGKRHSRNKFMKHKLEEKLDKYDESLTEYQNMRKNGFLRIYDAGSLRYKLVIKKGL